MVLIGLLTWLTSALFLAAVTLLIHRHIRAAPPSIDLLGLSALFIYLVTLHQMMVGLAGLPEGNPDCWDQPGLPGGSPGQSADAVGPPLRTPGGWRNPARRPTQLVGPANLAALDQCRFRSF